MSESFNKAIYRGLWTDAHRESPIRGDQIILTLNGTGIVAQIPELGIKVKSIGVYYANSASIEEGLEDIGMKLLNALKLPYKNNMEE